MFKSKKDRFKQNVQDAIIQSYDTIGKSVVGVVKNEAPVISGKLRDGVDYVIEDDGLYIFDDVDYAPLVEFGTYRMRANPFMRRGIFKSVENIRKIIMHTMGVK
jgi:HK97 gp10 family phage protein